MKSRYCQGCKVYKPVDNFYTRNDNGALRYTCKSCDLDRTNDCRKRRVHKEFQELLRKVGWA